MGDLVATAAELAARHESTLWALGIVSLVTLVASAAALPTVLARLPADYYAPDRASGAVLFRDRPLRRALWVAAKSAIGVALVLAGFVMLFVPGQGLLTILVGLALLEFPGKRAAERWLVRRRAVLRAANWLRARKGAAPLIVE